MHREWRFIRAHHKVDHSKFKTSSYGNLINTSRLTLLYFPSSKHTTPKTNTTQSNPFQQQNKHQKQPNPTKAIQPQNVFHLQPKIPRRPRPTMQPSKYRRHRLSWSRLH